jgi:hypothetical protein
LEVEGVGPGLLVPRRSGAWPTHTYRYTYTLIITSTPHTYTKATLSEEVQSWLKPCLLKVGLGYAEFSDLEDATTDNNMHNTHYQLTSK